MQPSIVNWSDDGNEFSVLLNDNPLADFVEIPADYRDLLFSNIIAGAVRGTLETVCYPREPRAKLIRHRHGILCSTMMR